MKILVSAIACDPYGGSEGGIGWAWVKTIALNHDVYCLTSGKHKTSWEKAQREGLVPENLKARFIGPEKNWSRNRMLARAQSWSRLLSFNRTVLEVAKEWHHQVCFDISHHVTYATWRVPSPLWKMPIPFVWGPIGGVSTIPRSFWGMLGFSAKAVEILRETQTKRAIRSENFQRCIQHAFHVFAANRETFEGMKGYRGALSMSILPSAFLQDEKVKMFESSFQKRSVNPDRAKPLQIFAGGNIEGRKGVDLALRALKLVYDEGIDFRYEIAGGGPEVGRLEGLAQSLGLNSRVQFRESYRGDGYLTKLRETDIYLLPSFRETTPVTLLEAMLSGCFPIVVDASAAGEIVDHCGGTAVAVASPDQVVEDLAMAMIQFAKSPDRKRTEVAEMRQNLIGMFCQERFIEESNRIYHEAQNIRLAEKSA